MQIFLQRCPGVNLIVRTVLYRVSSRNVSTAQFRVPLHAEWAEMAKKELKGKDPAEMLVWHTAEVNMI